MGLSGKEEIKRGHMAQIHVLDSETIDKIAAGEVVERPSSVVKELVENAIDAGATAVTVEIKDGGIEFIRVTDNGSGMEQGQLRTAFLRHATSKIANASDLVRISSLGFRGEALSSIAAVARVEVITKTTDSMTGTRIFLEGAREVSFEEVGAPDGTTFLVRNLFFNTPVRRKFLKQPATEGGYIVDLMEHLALSRPDISFKLQVGNQMKFHTSGNGDLKEVIYRIYGRDVAASLVPVQTDRDGIRVEGYLGKPVLVRSNRNFEIYFINGRFIRSAVVSRAVEEGYKEYLMQHKFPLCVLHISMEAANVDVNVHPTKMDVRFSDTISFSNYLMETVRDALRGREMIPEASLDGGGKGGKPTAGHDGTGKEQTPEPFEQKRSEGYRLQEESRYRAVAAEKKIQIPGTRDFTQNPVWSRVKTPEKTAAPAPVAETEEDFFTETSELPKQAGDAVCPPAEAAQDQDAEKKGIQISEEPGTIDRSGEPGRANEPGKTGGPKTASATMEMDEPGTANGPGGKDKTGTASESGESMNGPGETVRTEITDAPGNPDGPVQMDLFEEKILTADNRSRFRIIGQVFETYWLVQFEEKLMMVDQHAAHEKVNYERLMRQYHEKNVVSQTLMPPVIVSLSGQEETVLRENMEVFASLGFEAEPFGGSEYALRSVPVDLYGCGEREMFLEVLDQLCAGTSFGNIRVIEEKIASMSCKAAVKGNNLLSLPEAEALIDELLTLDNPYNCPHGRPTIVTMTKAELDRQFKRIV